MSSDVYPEDEFDRIGRTLPRGAHRPGQPWWHGFLPLIAVFIIAPLLGWAAFLLIGAGGSGASSDASSSQVASSQAATDASAAGSEAGSEAAGQVSEEPSEETSTATVAPTPQHITSESPSPSASAGESREAGVAGGEDLSRKVAVLNASGITGLAGKIKEEVAAEGFSNVSADNYQGQRPAQNTIYYLESAEAEAKKIQQLLGIDMIVPRTQLSPEIQVVLVNKP